MSTLVTTNANITNVNTGTIKDAGGNATAMTIASTGVADIPKQENRYELIKAYNSQSNNSLGSISGASVAAHIAFNQVFASHFISYKLVIGWLNFNHSSNHSINIRFTTGTNTELTTQQYRWHIHRMPSNTDTYVANNSGNSHDDRGQIFRQTSSGPNESNVGVHGEVNFYNVGNVTIGGNSTSVRFDSTADYSPMFISDLVGYDTASGAYCRENSFCRYNVSNVDGYFTGFTVMGETGELAGSHMALYGLRVS